MSRTIQKPRVIFHIDMNSFYASVEVAYDPSLKGKPLAIAGNVEERRGIIVTSSYEARAKGVKTTMPVWQAKRLCPEILLMTPNFPRYREASKKLFDLLRSYTDLVEPVSIDEGYMDVSDFIDSVHPIKLAREIQSRLLKELNLPSSIGIAPNKFLAKMASDMKKPMGITILRKRELDNMLWPLSIGSMHGVGPKTAEKLQALGIDTIGKLAKSDKQKVVELLGAHGEKLYDRANGKDERLVDPDAASEFKSISQSTTLSEDTTDEAVIRLTFIRLADKLEGRLKAKKVAAYNFSISIRYNDWKNVTRSLTVKQPIQRQKDIVEHAMSLFDRHWTGEPIRLLGISAQSLTDMDHAYKQLDLFSYEMDAKEEPLYHVIERINEKYGDKILRKGTKIDQDRKT